MKQVTIGLLALTACASDQRAPDPEALAEVGVARADLDGNGYVLRDAAGTQIGEVRFEAGATVVARLRENEARTQITGDGMTVSCNGQSILLAGEIDSAAVLAPCADALSVAAILIDPDAQREPTTTQNLLACYDAHIDGCVSWNAWQGCLVMQYCYVVWCDGGFSDYQCSIE